MKKKDKLDLIAEVQKRAHEGLDGDAHNREAAKKDLEFLLPGNQWDDAVRREREQAGRPCLEFNQLPVFLDQVLGPAKRNRPESRIIPKSVNADADTAEALQKLIREIRYDSMASVAHDRAHQQEVQSGFGCWRVYTDYEEDESFNQVIRIVPIYNQFSVIWDAKSRRWDRLDADWLIVYDRMSKDIFEAMYPKKTASSIQIGKLDSFWYEKDHLTVAEYFKREYSRKRVYQLSNGRVVEKEELDRKIESGELVDGLTPDLEALGHVEVRKEKDVLTYKIFGYKLTGLDILEGPDEWPSKYWPVIPLDGKDIVTEDGNQYKRGLIRYSHDATKAYNFSRSSEIETFAMAPKAPIAATAAMLEGHEEKWARSHKVPYPYLLYNPDPELPGVIPQRIEPPQLSTAITNSTMQAREELKSTIGIFSPHVDRATADASGVALQTRNKESEAGVLEFTDNLERALDLESRVLLDLIPTVYDTTREVRVRGADQATSIITINEPVLEGNKQIVKNDFKSGKYDVATKLGPAYNTARQEAADTLMVLAQYAPTLLPYFADQVVRAMDFAESGQIADRMKVGVVPRNVLTEEELKELMKKFPQSFAGSPPDPLIVAEVQKSLAQAQKYLADANKAVVETQGMRDENLMRALQVVQGIQMKINGIGQGQGQTAPEQMGQPPMGV